MVRTSDFGNMYDKGGRSGAKDVVGGGKGVEFGDGPPLLGLYVEKNFSL